MNETKLNNWIQIAATLGVIIGLILVAYEIRTSNRIGLDQANAESTDRFSALYEHLSSGDAAELLVRAHGGEELTRAEMYRLDNLYNLIITTLFHDWTTEQSGTISFEGGFEKFYSSSIQWYLDSAPARRKWDMDRGEWETQFANIFDRALAMADRRSALAELDYMRGVTESSE